jgi:hypothetical protein
MMRSLSILVLCVALLLQTESVLAEPYKPWNQLTQIQHEALQPLAMQWDSLPPRLQKHLLHSASYYRQLTPDQKKRFQSRLVEWSKLTPEQRDRARENFRAFKKSRPDFRKQPVPMAHEQTISAPVASSVEAKSSKP